MNCYHCQTWNDEYEHRCLRCARRLHEGAADLQPVRASDAPQRRYAGGQAAVLMEPERPYALPGAPERMLRYMSPDAVSYAPPTAAYSLPAPGEESGSLALLPRPVDDFTYTQHSRRVVDTTVEALIYNDSPRAHPVHRSLACALDTSLITIAAGLFILTLHFGGFGFSRQPVSLMTVGIAVALIVIAYRALWAAAGTDSPGMQWTHMQLLDFDGNLPSRGQRFARLFASALSALSCGLGVIWALVDEESLSWHDHMSRTYPSVRPLRY